MPASQELVSTAEVLAPALTLFALGVPAAFVGVRVLLKLVRAQQPGVPRWGILHVLWVASLGFLAMLAVGTLHRPDDVLRDLHLTVLVHGVAASAALWLVGYVQQDGYAVMGLRRAGLPRALLAGALAYAFCIPLLFGLGLLWPIALQALGWEPAPQEILQGILALDEGQRLQAFCFAVFVAPLLEELSFRGFLQPALERRAGGIAAVVLTSLAFALLHGLTPFLLVFALSLLLGLVQLRTRSLYACWLVHAIHNGLTLSFGFLSNP